MKETITFKLARAARSKGGDRYEGSIEGEDRPMVIYIPQHLSREAGKPAQTITVTIEA